jgi:hypothetical protein
VERRRLLGNQRQRVRFVGKLTAQQLVEHQAKRKDIGATIDIFGAAVLLGCHVQRRTQRRARASTSRPLAPVASLGLGRWSTGNLGDSEVEDLDAILRRSHRVRHQHQVFRLQVSVDDVLFVGRRQRPRRLLTDSRRIYGLWTNRWLHIAVEQRLAFQKLHDDVQRAVRFLPKLEDLDQPWVTDDVHRPGLVEEALGVLVVFGKLGVHHLDGGAATDGVMLSLVDDAHSAFADLAQEPEVAKHAANPRIVASHAVRGAV